MSFQGHYISDSDIDNWPDGASDTLKKNVIKRCEQLVEKVTNDVFYEKLFQKSFSGNGKDWMDLMLPSKILLVTQVKISGVELDSDWYDYDENSIFLSRNLDEVSLSLLGAGDRNLFPEGQKNIEVFGSYGWQETPEAIAEAVRILAKNENDSTLFTKYSDFDSMKLGDYSFKRDKKMLTGIVEADKWVRPFVRRVAKVSMV